jgi:hypothetical protein
MGAALVLGIAITVDIRSRCVVVLGVRCFVHSVPLAGSKILSYPIIS